MHQLEITLLDQQVLKTSSFLAFILPAIFLLFNKHYVHGLCSLLSGIGSITYWHDPKCTTYHIIDLIISRTCTCIYVGTTLYYAYYTSIEHILSTIVLTLQTIYYYMKSREAYNKFEQTWLIYHAAFHFCCFVAACFTYYLVATCF